jgi:8-oxo-dGTP pyrophosphatase MutT (NUDIX family)
MFPILDEDYITRCLEEAYHPGTFSSSDGYSNMTLETHLKCAAVLVPLVLRKGGWHLVLTHRTEEVEHHKGQVSFPGGSCDIGETNPEETALREAKEEIGLRFEDVHILGCLNDVLTITLYRITPVVGVISWPYKFQPEPVEVKRIFTIPLKWLSRPGNWDQQVVKSTRVSRPIQVISYHPYRGEILWGASAKITNNFLAVLGLLKV